MKRVIPIIALVFLYSCGENTNRVRYNPYELSPGSNPASIGFEIPFKTTSSNVKTIHIKLNDVEGTEAIFDTGCSGLLISTLEAASLAKQGTLSSNDNLGQVRSSIADGSVIVNAQYSIGEISVTDVNGVVHTISNVTATVVDNIDADVLVGNSVIDQLASTSYTIDLANSVIRFQ